MNGWATKAWMALTTPAQWQLDPEPQQQASQSEWMASHIVSRRQLTAQCVELTLLKPKAWKGHLAGQHIRLSLYLNGRRLERFYSLTNAPSERRSHLRIAVQIVDQGLMSTHLLGSAKVGDRIDVSAPTGSFHLPQSLQGDNLLMLSAGSGITPILSMLKQVHASAPQTKVCHMHYAPSPQQLIYAQELEALRNAWPSYQLHLSFTREAQPNFSQQRWSAQQQQRECPDWQQRQSWACGPDAWLQELENHWTQAGQAHRLHTERFHQPLKAAPKHSSEAHKVQFARSAQSAEVRDGTTLLEAAEKQGLSPQYGCRMGICHSCDCELVAGQVRDLRSNKILSQPGQRIQPCVSTPITAVEIAL